VTQKPSGYASTNWRGPEITQYVAKQNETFGGYLRRDFTLIPIAQDTVRE
jgi:hypothetical protein